MKNLFVRFMKDNSGATAIWHIAAFQTQAPNGRYWTNNGVRRETGKE
jgi:hypothetical protein